MRIIRTIAKRIIDLQPASDIHDRDLEYLVSLSNLYRDIQGVPGHIAEVGVADGRNAIIFGKLIKLHGDQHTRQYVGFDTFDGYVERDLGRDKHLDSKAWKNLDIQRVIRRSHDNNLEKLVEFHKGDVLETAPRVLKDHKGLRFQPGKALFALVYIDCNSYLTAIESMRIFLPHMAPGSRIAIDEKMQGGETEALLDFSKESELQLIRGTGPGSNAQLLVSVRT